MEPQSMVSAPETEKKTDFTSEIFDWVEMLLIAVAAVVLVFTFLFRTVMVDGDSMNPTLEDCNSLLISRLFYTPSFGDIVVITQPNSEGKTLIKRVIATGGQTLELDLEHNAVYVDGKEMNNSFILEPMFTTYDLSGPVTIPEGYVFVMGDNRNHSLDSRSTGVGMIREEYIMGRVFFSLLPFGSV